MRRDSLKTSKVEPCKFLNDITPLKSINMMLREKSSPLQPLRLYVSQFPTMHISPGISQMTLNVKPRNASSQGTTDKSFRIPPLSCCSSCSVLFQRGQKWTQNGDFSIAEETPLPLFPNYFPFHWETPLENSPRRICYIPR